MSNKPIIVIDPGHGGEAKVGGSSPNNATGANGLLEKNLTLDMANRVAATLAAQANVFLTRAGDTNIGLSDRAKIARDKNAAVFLSLHFNGFDDASVDGTEVWVAKNANQSSRDFATALLGHVAGSTGVKDRGLREGDLGVLLPSRHAPGTSACLLEVSFLTNPSQAKKLENDNYRSAIASSICAGLRQHLSLASMAQSFFYVSDDISYSGALDAPSVDDTAAQMGYASYDDYVAKEVKPAKLFGLNVEGGLRPDFHKKLQQAEKEAAKLIHPDGSPVTAAEWGIQSIRGKQPRKGGGWHPWGASIDIDYLLNPYVMHEAKEPGIDKLVAPVYRRIAQLMLKRASVISDGPDGIVETDWKKLKDPARVSRLYDSLLEESEALKQYVKIMQDQTLIQKEIDKHKPQSADFWKNVWGVTSGTPSLDDLQTIMMRDYVALSGQTGPAIAGKSYPDPSKLYAGLTGDAPFVKRKPSDGFLAIRKEIVKALTGENLRWGAIHFGGASGDVMHFDDGWGSFASKKRAADTALKPTAKGNAFEDEDVWDEQFDYSGALTYTVADVNWAADKDSPDYRHLGAKIDYTPFDLTAASLAKLCEANYFNVKSNPTDPRDEVIFALRGCCLSGGKESSGGFVSSVKLIEAIPDHQQSRCVIGVWKRSTNEVAAFLGSTVPYWKSMKTYAEGGEKCNMLATGRYLFTVGTHRASEPEFIIPGAIRQQTDVAVIRTTNNLIYEVTDPWDFTSPGDNIHPSRHPNPGDKFSSEGCLTIPGGGTYMTRTAKHDRLWSEFRKAAGLTSTSAPANEDGYQFVVVLLTGREARLANTLSKRDLTRLRFGSEGVDVKTLQLELSLKDRKAPGRGKYYTGKQDGAMGMATVRSYVEWQKDSLGWTDGIVTPAIAASLSFDIINHLCLKNPVPLTKQLDDSDAKPRKLTDDEIKEYKKINDTQKWKDKKGNKAQKRTFNEDIIWELPEKGDGFINYNRNDQIEKPSDYNDPKGLDEIGTKETIEKVFAIAKEWNKLHSDQPLQIGDISRPGGIDTPDHSGHMQGTEVDIRPMRKKNGTGPFTYKHSDIYSVDLTKEFIRCVRLLYPKASFFFNDKAIYEDKEFKAFVTSEEGHDNHLHLIF